MTLPRLSITREHGSWAVLAIPLAVGTAASQTLLWEHGALAVAALAAFLSHVPLKVVLESLVGRPHDPSLLRDARWWAAILAAVALSLTALLVTRGAAYLLTCMLIGAVSVALRWAFRQGGWYSMVGDLSAVAGLSLGAPAAYALGSAALSGAAFKLWAQMFLFFGCTVVYVHMKIRATAEKSGALSFADRIRFGWMTVVYHIAVVTIVAFVLSSQHTPLLAVAAYLPMTIHAVVGVVRLKSSVRFKRLGFLLLAHSVAFGTLLVLASKRSL